MRKRQQGMMGSRASSWSDMPVDLGNPVPPIPTNPVVSVEGSPIWTIEALWRSFKRVSQTRRLVCVKDFGGGA